jgi:hypothetical protein
MAAVDLNQELVFHKIGKGLLETVSGNINEIIYGQKMKFDVKATLVDVEGGDSLFPIYTFISKKEGTIDVEMATFSLGQTGIGNSVEYSSTSVLVNQRILATKSATTLGTYTGVTNVRCIAPDGSRVTVSQAVPTTPDTETLYVTATGDLTWGSGLVAGEYRIWFQYVTTQEATMTGLLKNEMPEVSSFTWTFDAETPDGAIYQVDIFAKRVRADGSFTIDASRSAAVVPKLSLKLLDPGDGTDDFCTITLSKKIA